MEIKDLLGDLPTLETQRLVNSLLAHIALIIAALCLVGCSVLPTVQPTPTLTPPPVSEQEAIERAVPSCGSAHLRPKETPYNIRAHLTYRDGILVWLVEMEGTWEVLGGPAPSPTPTGQLVSPLPTPTPAWLHYCTATVDAATGRIIGSTARGEK
jgi:hypothetical protein